MRVLVAATILGVASAQDDTGRDLLFSDPTADLPDVKISDSVKYVNEGSSFYYTVELTHQPGLREDNTLDRANDEVRIYLSSSQEVYQQGVAHATQSTAEAFVQTLGHRTQLVIDTNVVKCAEANGGSGAIQQDARGMGQYTDKACFSDATANELADGWCLDTATGITTAGTKATCLLPNLFTPTSSHVMGPLPYVYVAYSTKTPTQPSVLTTSGTKYDVVCPLCTHPKFCTMGTAIIDHSNKVGGVTAGADQAVGGGGTEVFDGCLKLTYIGFAPAYDACLKDSTVADLAALTYGTTGTTLAERFTHRVKAGGAGDDAKHCIAVDVGSGPPNLTARLG
jgi:hypothetical protein